MSKKNIVYEHGINDMPRGWVRANEWNRRVHRKWKSMLRRIYSDECQDKNPSYVKCTCQLELHWLSYFVNNIENIDGYDYEKFMNGELELDKDIKTNGINKEYSIENCMFVSKPENIRQSNKTQNYDNMKRENNYFSTVDHKGEKHPRALKVEQWDNDGKCLLRFWNCIKDIEDELKINSSSIVKCCKGKRKTAGGFVWKYVEEEL